MPRCQAVTIFWPARGDFLYAMATPPESVTLPRRHGGRTIREKHAPGRSNATIIRPCWLDPVGNSLSGANAFGSSMHPLRKSLNHLRWGSVKPLDRKAGFLQPSILAIKSASLLLSRCQRTPCGKTGLPSESPLGETTRPMGVFPHPLAHTLDLATKRVTSGDFTPRHLPAQPAIAPPELEWTIARFHVVSPRSQRL